MITTVTNYYHCVLREGDFPPTKVCSMSKKYGDVLTIAELAAYVKVSKSTLYKLVREGKVPCQKVGRHWRFRKEAIDRWLEQKETASES